MYRATLRLSEPIESPLYAAPLSVKLTVNASPAAKSDAGYRLVPKASDVEPERALTAEHPLERAYAEGNEHASKPAQVRTAYSRLVKQKRAINHPESVKLF
ncbi:hypothetical protein HA45_12980 [Pantoea rodasii]|nr:hypothetical protein HA45_12980 [Pantoea rodasii]